MKRQEYEKKMADLQVIKGIDKGLWARSFAIQDYPESVTAICLRRGSVRPAQEYLRAAFLGDHSEHAARPVPPPMRRFGVEIECFGASRQSIIEQADAQSLRVYSETYNHADNGYAKIVSDASIRGADANEVVMPPARDFDDLRGICRALRAAGARVNRSCGLHVHIDAAGMAPDHAYRVALNYYRLRGVINAGLAPSRRANWYCAVVCPQNAAMNSWALLARGGNRYEAVNFQAYRRHTTLEFRQHQGTVNFAKIRRWVLFLQSLVEWSATHELDGDVTRRDDPCLAGLRVDHLRELAA